MDNALDFFLATMPKTRPADYYLGCFGGSVYLDFNNYENGLICLIRISFDGYGCCDLPNYATPMNLTDSQNFKQIIKEESFDQDRLAAIVKRTILDNKKLIWGDALNEYGLS